MDYLKDIKTLETVLKPIKESIGTIQGFSKSQIETIYAASYGLYEAGNYAEAAALFTRLILQDPFQIRFWKGLASSRQMNQEFKAALHAWAIVGILADHPPLAHFHAAECLVSLGEKADALKALACAKEKLNKEDPLFEKIETLKMRIESHG